MSKQPRFQTAVNCIYKEVFERFNEWKIITLKSVPIKEAGEDFDAADEMEEIFNDILGEYEIEAANEISKDGFGAYQTDDPEANGFYIIRWTTDAYTLDEDSFDVEGMDGIRLEAGSQVVDGVYWNPVPRAKDWYTPPNEETIFTFRVRYCLKGEIYLIEPTDSYPFPRIKYREQALSLNPLKISDGSREQLNQALNQRKLIDFIEGNLQEDSEKDGDEEQQQEYDESTDSESSNTDDEDDEDDGDENQPP